MKRILAFLTCAGIACAQTITRPNILEPDYKVNVAVATAAVLPAVTATATTLTANAAGALTVDGMATALNMRILVTDQVATENNGIYKMTRAGTGAVAFILTRDTDADSWAELPGSVVRVTAGGTANENTTWYNNSALTGTLGTTAITYEEGAGGGAAASDVAYDATTWDANTDAATKNAIRDKIESLSGGFDATAVDAVTWSDGANASNIWSFDVSGTDTTLTLGSGVATFSHALGAASIELGHASDTTLARSAAGVISIEGIALNNGTKTIARFGVRDNEPPATNYATLWARNSHPVLEFNTTTQETAIFRGVIPQGAVLTGGVTVFVQWAAKTATTGTIGWDIAFERIASAGLDIDADSFGTAQTVTATTVSGTSGITLVTSVNFSQAQLPASLAAGESYRVRIRRDVANDDATDDAQLLNVWINLQ